MLQWRRHVAEPRRRADSEAAAGFEIGQLDIRRPLGGYWRRGGLRVGRHRWHSPQPCLRAVDTVDAGRDRFCQAACGAVARVEEYKYVHVGGAALLRRSAREGAA